MKNIPSSSSAEFELDSPSENTDDIPQSNTTSHPQKSQKLPRKTPATQTTPNSAITSEEPQTQPQKSTSPKKTPQKRSSRTNSRTAKKNAELLDATETSSVIRPEIPLPATENLPTDTSSFSINVTEIPVREVHYTGSPTAQFSQLTIGDPPPTQVSEINFPEPLPTQVAEISFTEPPPTQASEIDYEGSGTQAFFRTSPSGAEVSSHTPPFGEILSGTKTELTGEDSLPPTVPSSSRSTWRGHTVNTFKHHAHLLADGLVVAPEIKRVPVSSLLLRNPVVSESRRNCWNCKKPIAREIDSNDIEHLSGKCPYCSAEYRFTPSLFNGQVVADQYDIQGAFAYGGLGWLYLAIDKNVSNRIVVLKGMLTAHSGEAKDIATAERKFLAEVEHPGIVRIFNFVEDSDDSDLNHGYIVMEYFPGKTLHQVQKENYEKTHSIGLPIELAIGYVLDVLPALSYLHSLNLVYNDLKPENIMANDEGTKLIDLGSVSVVNAYGRIYGTPGFQAPDIIQNGPSALSDIYTVGRTLLALILGNHVLKKYPNSIPTPAEEPLFAKYDSLYQLLLRATAPEAQERFMSADELRIELFGVLREVLSIKTQRPHAALSRIFNPIREAFGINEILIDLPQLFKEEPLGPHFNAENVFHALPTTILDQRDPAYSSLSAALSQNDPNLVLENLRNIEINDPLITQTSAQFHYSMVRTLLDAKEIALAKSTLANIPDALKITWNYYWLAGLCELLMHDYRSAHEYFFTVYTKLPGEMAPRLAVGAAAELYTRELSGADTLIPTPIGLKSVKRNLWSVFRKTEVILPKYSSNDAQIHAGDIAIWSEKAAQNYKIIWTLDNGQISAALGYARMATQIGDIPDAVSLLDSVPVTSRYYLIARASAAMLLIYNRNIKDLHENALRHASVRIQSLPELDPNRSYLRALLFTVALSWILFSEDDVLEVSGPLLGFEFSEIGMRIAAEQAYRHLAKTAPQFTRYYLVDLANSIRPRTLF